MKVDKNCHSVWLQKNLHYCSWAVGCHYSLYAFLCPCPQFGCYQIALPQEQPRQSLYLCLCYEIEVEHSQLLGGCLWSESIKAFLAIDLALSSCRSSRLFLDTGWQLKRPRDHFQQTIHMCLTIAEVGYSIPIQCLGMPLGVHNLAEGDTFTFRLNATNCPSILY